MAEATAASRPAPALRRMLIPLALAQFICSFAGSNMNVMINDISKDLNTTVEGVQTCITLFLLVMAALMIPGGKLTDRWGRKRCFVIGLTIYGIGALISAVSPGIGVLIIGNSILEGAGTALLIPPVYILTTMLFQNVQSRARAFGVIMVVVALLLAWFFVHIRADERAGKEPLLSTALFRNRKANLGMVTQNVQWLLLMGSAFVVSAYLQVIRGYNAIQTGLIFTAATGGILVSSLAAERAARKYAQRTLIMAGFITTIAGVVVLLALVKGSPSAWAFAPGLLLIGLGVGVMLTPSVNVVQSAFPEGQQGEISGLSRCISNLGSSLGTAIAGTILVSSLTNRSYAASMAVLAIIGLVGLGAALFLPAQRA